MGIDVDCMNIQNVQRANKVMWNLSGYFARNIYAPGIMQQWAMEGAIVEWSENKYNQEP